MRAQISCTLAEYIVTITYMYSRALYLTVRKDYWAAILVESVCVCDGLIHVRICHPIDVCWKQGLCWSCSVWDSW